MSRVALVIATAGFVGFVPVAPGTAGSAVGLFVYGVLRAFDSSVGEGLAILLSLVVGIWSADVVEQQLGKDPGPVVIDEVLGMLVTLAFLNVTAVGAIVGFILFRVYDVVKPYPAARLENLHGGPGIMLDDVVAGIYGHLTMRLLITLVPGVLA
jgi:phosphatidylglycerophosphatase A